MIQKKIKEIEELATVELEQAMEVMMVRNPEAFARVTLRLQKENEVYSRALWNILRICTDYQEAVNRLKATDLRASYDLGRIYIEAMVISQDAPAPLHPPTEQEKMAQVQGQSYQKAGTATDIERKALAACSIPASSTVVEAGKPILQAVRGQQ